MRIIAKLAAAVACLSFGVSAAIIESPAVGIAKVEVHRDATKIYLTVYPSTLVGGYSSFVYDETSTADLSDIFKLLYAQALTAKTTGTQVSIRYDNNGGNWKGIMLLE